MYQLAGEVLDRFLKLIPYGFDKAVLPLLEALIAAWNLKLPGMPPEFNFHMTYNKNK